jgi:hypothetical protein
MERSSRGDAFRTRCTEMRAVALQMKKCSR